MPVTRLPVRMGGGPVISLVDTLVGPMTCGYVTKKAGGAGPGCEPKGGISLQFITMCEDHYGTDAIGITNEGATVPVYPWACPGGIPMRPTRCSVWRMRRIYTGWSRAWWKKKRRAGPFVFRLRIQARRTADLRFFFLRPPITVKAGRKPA